MNLLPCLFISNRDSRAYCKLVTRYQPIAWLQGILLLTLVFVSSCGHVARAQVIDQLFPANVAGDGFESVLSRPRTDFDARGVRVGSFAIDPILTEAFGYDSNVDGLKDGHGSPTIETIANVNVASNWSRDSLGAFLSVDDQRNVARSQQNQTSWMTSLFATYDIGSDKIFTSYTHLNLNQNANDIDAALTTSPTPFRVDDARLSYESMEHGRWTFIPDVELTTYRFGIGSIGDTSQSFRNRDVYEGELTTRYELASLRNIVFVLRGVHINYDEIIKSVASRNSNGAAALSGVDYSAAGVLRFRAHVGYQARANVSAAYANLAEPIAEASVTWTPTRLTTMTASAIRDIQDAADDNVAGFTYTTGKLSIDHEYRRDLLLSIHTQVQRAELASRLVNVPELLQTAGSQTILNIGVGATWYLSRMMRVSATYDHNDRHAGGGLGNYSQNVALLSVSFQL